MKFFKNKLAVTIIVLSVTFLIMIGYSATRTSGSAIENESGTIINNIQGFVYNIGIKIQSKVSSIFNFTSIKEENEKLKIKNAEFETKAAQYDNIINENDKLRKMLSFNEKRQEFKYIGADIVARGSGSWNDSFTINKGSKDGIIMGLVAITPEGLVGQVTSINENFSEIQTIGSKNIFVSTYITNVSSEMDINKINEKEDENSKPIGILSGYRNFGDSSLFSKIIYLPLNSKIKEGDSVFTSGLGGVYPKDIRIGEVTAIEEDKGKAMKSVIVKPYISFDKLEQVFIVIPKNGIPTTGQLAY